MFIGSSSRLTPMAFFATIRVDKTTVATKPANTPSPNSGSHFHHCAVHETPILVYQKTLQFEDAAGSPSHVSPIPLRN